MKSRQRPLYEAKKIRAERASHAALERQHHQEMQGVHAVKSEAACPRAVAVTRAQTLSEVLRAAYPRRGNLLEPVCECDAPQGDEAYCLQCGSAAVVTTFDGAPEDWCHASCGPTKIGMRPALTHRQEAEAFRKLGLGRMP